MHFFLNEGCLNKLKTDIDWLISTLPLTGYVATLTYQRTLGSAIDHVRMLRLDVALKSEETNPSLEKLSSQLSF